MTQPTVAAVMLINGREAMVRKAVECVRNQEYRNLEIVMLDTGDADSRDVMRMYRPDLRGLSIGALRNEANSRTDADIIIHFDSDDYSNPNRIAEQVTLLQATGADAVGYNECLFWDERACMGEGSLGGIPWPQLQANGQAWLYTNTSRAYAIGASLCYWRKAWEQHQFPDAPKNSQASGEDTLWLREVTCTAVSAFRDLKPTGPTLDLSPRMVCRVHPGNTMKYELAGNSWRRVVEQDVWCKGRMAL